MNKLKKILLSIFVIYLIISAIYVLFHIDFLGQPKITSPGFSPTNNFLRLFMGLPKTYTTYEGVSPLFLIEVLIKITLAIIFIKYFKKNK